MRLVSIHKNVNICGLVFKDHVCITHDERLIGRILNSPAAKDGLVWREDFPDPAHPRYRDTEEGAHVVDLREVQKNRDRRIRDRFPTQPKHRAIAVNPEMAEKIKAGMVYVEEEIPAPAPKKSPPPKPVKTFRKGYKP